MNFIMRDTHNKENLYTHIITPSDSCPAVLSPLTCSPPVSHLGSEDTDAVHHHRLHQQTFTKTSSSSNFPAPPLSRLLLLVTYLCRLSVTVSSFSSSSCIPQSLSPPSPRILSTCPFVRATGEDFSS